MIEKALEFNKELTIIMVDFEKAFDSICWDAIWDALEKTTIDRSYIDIIKATYQNSRARIRTSVGTSDYISIERSVKQGDKLACLLFCLVLAMVIIKTEEQIPETGRFSPDFQNWPKHPKWSKMTQIEHFWIEMIPYLNSS